MASIENREGKCSRTAGSAVPVNAPAARSTMDDDVERAASPFKTTRAPHVVRGIVERAACAFMTQKQQVCLKQFKGKVYENNEPN